MLIILFFIWFVLDVSCRCFGWYVGGFNAFLSNKLRHLYAWLFPKKILSGEEGPGNGGDVIIQSGPPGAWKGKGEPPRKAYPGRIIIRVGGWHYDAFSVNPKEQTVTFLGETFDISNLKLFLANTNKF